MKPNKIKDYLWNVSFYWFQCSEVSGSSGEFRGVSGRWPKVSGGFGEQISNVKKLHVKWTKSFGEFRGESGKCLKFRGVSGSSGGEKLSELILPVDCKTDTHLEKKLLKYNLGMNATQNTHNSDFGDTSARNPITCNISLKCLVIWPTSLKSICLTEMWHACPKYVPRDMWTCDSMILETNDIFCQVLSLWSIHLPCCVRDDNPAPRISQVDRVAIGRHQPRPQQYTDVH